MREHGVASALGSFVMLGALLVRGNIVCVGGQWLETAGDRALVEELEVELTARRPSIEAMETRLTEQDRALAAAAATVEACKEEVADFEAEAVGGELPPERYEVYEATLSSCNAQVDAYNRLLSSFQDGMAEYDREVDAYNVLVSRYNAAADRAGSITFLVPIPLGKAGKAAR